METKTFTASRRSVEVILIPRYQASVEWYGPMEIDGSRRTGWVTCPHSHITREIAEKCQDTIARRIERSFAGVTETAVPE